jgi:hypothetical protein
MPTLREQSMIVEVQVHIGQGRVRIDIPQASLQVKIPDIVACHTATRQIVAIGRTEQEVRNEAPEQMERHGDKIEFRPAFDTSHFEPEFTVAVLRYYADKAQARIRPGLLTRSIASYVDRFHYDLQLPGYEGLPAKTQRKFVQYLRTLPCMKKCVINGKLVLGR